MRWPYDYGETPLWQTILAAIDAVGVIVVLVYLAILGAML